MVGRLKKNLFAETNHDFTFSHIRESSKIFNITSKYFSFFKNKPPSNWVAHITRVFLTCYSCSYYSSMIAGIWLGWKYACVTKVLETKNLERNNPTVPIHLLFTLFKTLAKIFESKSNIWSWPSKQMQTQN